MSKTTVSAPANIAFIKYWGARDLERALPLNSSISMTLEECVTQCTVETLGHSGEDEVWLAEPDGGFGAPDPEYGRRIRQQLERIRKWAGRTEAVRMATRNTFPTAGGLASSASGFAALTLAAAGAFGKKASAKELSLLARRSGSGSACRSIFGGFVEWTASRGNGNTQEDSFDEDSYARQLADAEHWDLRNVIAVVEIGPKTVPSIEGHRRALTSPYFEKRQERLPERLEKVRRAIRERDLAALGPVIEEEAIDLHLIAMSSQPPIFYWSPGTIAVLRAVRELRQEGLAAWATMDAGANVHVLCDADSDDEVADRLEDLPAVGFVIRDGVGPGPDEETEHLF
ncbi:MAG TPA: diphosphomevalonate decarboxylase [Thermoanaerobaculia bacterium]|jgi:diphosphomevalonate decarboxylase|nr:diphosphomevalonate decarboxylase [Thermoanaerobaculia bacterium]